jgi:RNA polymerase sigma-B factor
MTIAQDVQRPIDSRKEMQLNQMNNDSEELVLRYLENPRPELKDLIMVTYTSLVERTARKFSGIEAFEDLVQVGYIGLLNALSKFDPTAGVRFNTYATYLVAGEIKHYLRDKSQTIRQPAWLQELRHKVNRAAAALQTELNRVPTEREIADAIGISESSVHEVIVTQDLLRVGSLDSMQNAEDDTESEIDKIDAAQFSPEQLSVEDRVVLEHAMDQLRDLEKQVLTMFHFDAMNQTEIAAKLDISCNYVSHILRQSLSKLRKILTTEETKDRMLRRQETSGENNVLDAASGAYTEAYFKTRLEEELHRASFEKTVVALMLVDFRGLEGLRKFYGEQSVLDFLCDAAEFFRDNVRRLDVVARYGSTGFAIILPSGGKNIQIVKDRLHERLMDWVSGRYGSTGAIQTLIGEAISPVDGRGGNELTQRAHSLMVGSDQIAA